jgi:hypothetical protein
MKPRQYTGKSNATQGEPSRISDPSGTAAPITGPGTDPGQPSSDPAAAVRSAARGGADGTPDQSPSGKARVVLWGLVAVALVAGLVLYFRYERAVVPLFGGGR